MSRDPLSRRLRLGFVALTDAAPLIQAYEQGLYAARGLDVELVRQASWPALRDAVLDGTLHAAHCLATLPYSVAAGLTGEPGRRLPIVMTLSTGGQAVTLGMSLADPRFGDPAGADEALRELAGARRLTLAMTYPGGTHDLLLRAWLERAGVDPAGLDLIPIPPAQMVANLRGGTMDGFCAGEPWNAVAAERGDGFTAITSGEILPGDPEKVLVANAAALARRREELRAVVDATAEACRALDDPAARPAAAQVLAARRYVNAPAEPIAARLSGAYPRGGGLAPEGRRELAVAFHAADGGNAPDPGHGMRTLARLRAWGMARAEVDDERLVAELVVDLTPAG